MLLKIGVIYLYFNLAIIQSDFVHFCTVSCEAILAASSTFFLIRIFLCVGEFEDCGYAPVST